jgi:hypothetical protein
MYPELPILENGGSWFMLRSRFFGPGGTSQLRIRVNISTFLHFGMRFAKHFTTGWNKELLSFANLFFCDE